MKKKLILIFILFFNAPLFAQNSAMDLARYEMYYWKLRGRLTGDDNNRDVYNGFMQVGAGKGKSLPAAIRFPTYGREYWRFNYETYPTKIAECYHQHLNGVRTGNYSNPNSLPDPRDGNELKGINYWGDNPIITLGQYIGVLALEWNLLNREGANTQRTLEELYYALEAVDRLDYEGESLYGLPADKNGFMIRGDTPKDFEITGNGKNIDMVLAHTACWNNNKPDE